ncbi:MAG: carbon starvation protein A [Muribaculaceae bacterium]|nr:carbon starvation protein A [Muribaculaceae bacterium]
MISFSLALLLLVAGYFIYGTAVSRIFGQDPKRVTPVHTRADGVDFVELPTWKIFLIQFLNIAGLGPIFGAIMGVMFGPAAFLWIVFGTIFAGAVHDYMSGMMSLRSDGASLPEIVGSQLGKGIKNVMRVFSLLLMILVGAVFVYNPADLMAMLTPDHLDRTFWIVVIFAYYMLATLLPIDKLIGRLYPLFGLALLFMAVGIMTMLYVNAGSMPEIWENFGNRRLDADTAPIFPMMFVSIACGAISGFHATQSPMMARCLKNERHARPVFYGAMVTEGIVALIWAAAAVTFTGGYEELQHTLGEGSPAILVNSISRDWLGAAGGILAILGVIAAPVTSGDTALRSARLIAADFMNIPQKKIIRRLAVSVPIFILCFIVMSVPYEVLWRYFSWCNQVLSVFTLWAITVYLAKHGKTYAVTMIPAMFMTAVTVTYILYAPEGLTALTTATFGTQISYEAATGVGITAAALLGALFMRYRRSLENAGLAGRAR